MPLAIEIRTKVFQIGPVRASNPLWGFGSGKTGSRLYQLLFYRVGIESHTTRENKTILRAE